MCSSSWKSTCMCRISCKGIPIGISFRPFENSTLLFRVLSLSNVHFEVRVCVVEGSLSLIHLDNAPLYNVFSGESEH